MRLPGLPLVFLAAAVSATSAQAGEVRIVRTAGDQLRIIATDADARQLASALRPYLDREIAIRASRPVSLDSIGGDGEGLAWAVAATTGQVLAKSDRTYRILPAGDATVTLDGYSQSSRAIIREMASQCGIRNLALDPGIGDPALTIRFEDVPCVDAFKVVLRSAGWQAEGAGNLMRVSTP